MNEPDHYRILGVSPEAPKPEIQAAYRRRLRQTHPDHGGDPGAFHQVQQAWETLADPRARREYDLLTFGRRAARRYGRAAARPSHRKVRGSWKVQTAPPAPDPAAGADLVAVPWYARLRRGRVAAKPALWRELLTLGATLALWAAAAIAFCAAAMATDAHLFIRALSIPLVLAGALVVAGQTLSDRRKAATTAPPPPTRRMIIAALIGVAAVWTAGITSPIGWWLAVYATAGAALAWPARRARWAARLRRTVGAALRDFNAFGPVGTRPKADRPTGRLLREVLTNLPAARLFVALPAAEHERIPHAIVCGNRLALLCAPVARDTGDVDAARLAAAVAEVDRALPHAHVHGWVLWPALPETAPPDPDGTVDHLPVATAAGDIGLWLAAGGNHYDLPVLQSLRLRLATVPAQRATTPTPAVRA